MKTTRTGAVLRLFPAARLASCVVVVMAALGAPCTEVQAAGLYTHTWFVERAIEKLKELDALDPQRDYSELVGILERHPATVNYGALFPDVAMRANADWGEVVHDTVAMWETYTPGVEPYEQRNRACPPLRAALIAQLMPNFVNTPRSEGDEKKIAFLFGLISHQEADTPWHFFDGYIEGELAKKWQNELTVDQILYHYDPSHLVEFAFLTEELKQVIRAASAAANEPAPDRSCTVITDWWTYCTEDPIDVGHRDAQIGWGVVTSDLGADDEIKQFVEEYEPGGINHGARLVAVTWVDTWDSMAGASSVDDTGGSGCGCSAGGFDASLLSLAIALTAMRRRRQRIG